MQTPQKGPMTRAQSDKSKFHALSLLEQAFEIYVPGESVDSKEALFAAVGQMTAKEQQIAYKGIVEGLTDPDARRNLLILGKVVAAYANKDPAQKDLYELVKAEFVATPKKPAIPTNSPLRDRLEATMAGSGANSFQAMMDDLKEEEDAIAAMPASPPLKASPPPNIPTRVPLPQVTVHSPGGIPPPPPPGGPPQMPPVKAPFVLPIGGGGQATKGGGGGGGGGGGMNVNVIQTAMENALAQHRAAEEANNVDDNPWEIVHKENETNKIRYGEKLMNSAAMRSGKEAMPDAPYMGNRGLQEGDIRRAGFKRNAAGQEVPSTGLEETGGDEVVQSKQSMENSTDTLRTLFKEASPDGVVPTKRQQVLSDIMFDSFNTVLPGWGNGMANKMFLMEEEREQKIVYAEPLAEPRPWIGPIQGPDTPQPEFQEQLSKRDRRAYFLNKERQHGRENKLARRVGDGSLNVLGDDVGFLRPISDKGLPRARESVFEPIIVNSAPWQPVKLPTGEDLTRVKMRKLFDAERMPNKIKPSMSQNDGPTFPRRDAFAVMYSLPAMT